MLTLNKLYNIIISRKKFNANSSYVANLFKQGTLRIAQKLGEEGVEAALASTTNNKVVLCNEIADLWFHSLILMAQLDIKPKDIFKVLESRNKKR